MPESGLDRALDRLSTPLPAGIDMDGHGGRIDGFYDPFGRSVALLAAWRTTTRERHATSTNGDSATAISAGQIRVILVGTRCF